MADEIMVAVAAALAGKAAEAAVQGARGGWGALVRLVRQRFSGDLAAAAALQAAGGRPSDQAAVRELARMLERAAAADAGFAARLRSLWPEASAELASQAGAGDVVNTVTGTVGGHLIQAGDLHVEGGLRLGDVTGGGQR